MAALIAVTAFVLFTAGVVAGIIGMVCVAIHREEKRLTLTGQATDHVTRAGRWLNGVGVRASHRSMNALTTGYSDVIESLHATEAKSAQPGPLAGASQGTGDALVRPHATHGRQEPPTAHQQADGQAGV